MPTYMAIPQEYTKALIEPLPVQEMREHVDAQCIWVRQAVDAGRLEFTDCIDIVTTGRCGTSFDGQHQITTWQGEIKGRKLSSAPFWIDADGMLSHMSIFRAAGCEASCLHPEMRMQADTAVIASERMGAYTLWVISCQLAEILAGVH